MATPAPMLERRNERNQNGSVRFSIKEIVMILTLLAQFITGVLAFGRMQEKVDAMQSNVHELQQDVKQILKGK